MNQTTVRSTAGVVKVPSAGTLRRYGLTQDEWVDILISQSHVCAVCGKLPPSGRLVTDHEHIRGWKKMSPEKRKLYVRGLCCWTCNHYFLARGITYERARRVAKYLRNHTRRVKNGVPLCDLL